MRSRVLYAVSLVVALAGMSWAASEGPPMNTPAEVEWNAGKGTLSLRYNGTEILNATIKARKIGGGARRLAVNMESTEVLGDKVEQRLKFVLAKPQDGVELVLRGAVTGSDEAFPAETRSAAQKRFSYVRNSVGLSHNLRNNAVYDRHWDWVLVGPADGRTRIKPAVQEKGRIAFSWESRGRDLEIVFRPLFYQKYKNLKHYQPWTYKPWKDSVTGWCSWSAYGSAFNEKELDAIVDVMASKGLGDFGYRYIQIDDTYQTAWSIPEGWLTWNDKFPGGPEHAVKKIRSGGFEAGIWVYATIDEQADRVADEHPDWFVHDASGNVLKKPGRHKRYGINAANEEALDQFIRPTYRGFKRQGFQYVKLDGLRHMLYSWYHRALDHFEEMNTTPDEVYRKYFRAIRDELSRETFILSCYGILPESIGIADGCRLSSDGFGPSTLQQYNSWNGVVWRSDPDHCDILPRQDAGDITMQTFAVKNAPWDTIVRPTIVSMGGGILMLSDRAEVYRDDKNLEGVKRSSPVMFTVPGQLYDVDSARSDNLVTTKRTDIKRSGAAKGGPLAIEADKSLDVCSWWLLEIDRPFEHWNVLARFNWNRAELPETEIKFSDLGLPAGREHMIYEFWSQKFLGMATGTFTVPAQGKNNGVQVFAIREVRAHPWLISTSRHISQGGVDLVDVRWNNKKKILSGKSSVVKGDPYAMIVHVPEGFRIKTAEAGNENVETKNLGRVVAVRMTPSVTKTVNWKITFDE